MTSFQNLSGHLSNVASFDFIEKCTTFPEKLPIIATPVAVAHGVVSLTACVYNVCEMIFRKIAEQYVSRGESPNRVKIEHQRQEFNKAYNRLVHAIDNVTRALFAFPPVLGAIILNAWDSHREASQLRQEIATLRNTVDTAITSYKPLQTAYDKRVAEQNPNV